jgi:hypothetical protein
VCTLARTETSRAICRLLRRHDTHRWPRPAGPRPRATNSWARQAHLVQYGTRRTVVAALLREFNQPFGSRESPVRRGIASHGRAGARRGGSDDGTAGAARRPRAVRRPPDAATPRRACLPRAAGRGGAARRLRPHRGDATPIRTETPTSPRRRAVRLVAFVLPWRART